MAWFKCNKTKIANNLIAANNNYTSLEKIVNEMARLDMYEENFKGEKKDDSGNWTSFWRSWQARNRRYQGAADKIHDEAVWMQQNILKPFKIYCDSLNSISTMVSDFDNQEISLAAKFKVFADGGRFQLDTNGDGTSANFVIDAVQGTEIMYYAIKDADGNWSNITIPEMVNSFYTENGMNMSQIITEGLLDIAAGGSGYLTPERVNEIMEGTNSFVTDFLPLGAFGVASAGDIEQVNASLEIDASEVETMQINSAELNVSDVMSEVTGSVGVGMAFIGAYTLTDGFTSDVSVGPSSNNNPPEVNTTPSVQGTPSSQNPTGPITPSTPSQPTTPTNPGNVGTITTQPETTVPVTNPPTPTTPEEDDRLIQVDPEVTIPEPTTEPTISPDDLDDMARDEYYNRYDPDSLADHQAEMLRQYEDLYNEQDRDKLIDMFKEMGYNDAEAIAAANNRDIGQSAFLLGMQNKELTDIANSFAEEYGLTEGFDTSYDDTPDFADLYDGDAQASLTAPYESDAIMEAKENVTEAKDAYIESVATANTSISAATEAKENMNEVRASIEAKSGTDTSKWTEEDIAKYNKATENYNTAVTKANEDAAAAEAAKATYDAAKESLEQAEDDYYNKIRNGVQAQGGTQPGQDTPQGNTPQQNVGGNVPDTGVTNTGNTTGNNEEENNTGNTSNDPFAEDMMNAFMGSK